MTRRGQVRVAFLLITMVGMTLNFVMLSWGVGVLMQMVLLTPIGVVAGFQLGRIRRSMPEPYAHQCGNGPPRGVQFLRAKWGGYFWLPCPVCKRKFGGHEWKYQTNRIFSFPDEPWRGEGVCSMECVLIYETQS